MSPCHRRLRTLEKDGVIAGYRAVLDLAAVGLTFEALVFVTMRGADHDTITRFEHAVAGLPHVLQGPTSVR